jgi:hypothetical protein
MNQIVEQYRAIIQDLAPVRILKMKKYIRARYHNQIEPGITDEEWKDIPEPLRAGLLRMNEAIRKLIVRAIAQATEADPSLLTGGVGENGFRNNAVASLMSAVKDKPSLGLQIRMWFDAESEPGIQPLMISVASCCAAVYPDGVIVATHIPANTPEPTMQAFAALLSAISPESDMIGFDH